MENELDNVKLVLIKELGISVIQKTLIGTRKINNEKHCIYNMLVRLKFSEHKIPTWLILMEVCKDTCEGIKEVKSKKSGLRQLVVENNKSLRFGYLHFLK